MHHFIFLIICNSAFIAFFSCSNPKILLVGIQKSGTSSFHAWFESMGFRSAHFRVKEGIVAELIFRAKTEKKPLLSYLTNYDAITQMNKAFPANEKFRCYYPEIQKFRTWSNCIMKIPMHCLY